MVHVEGDLVEHWYVVSTKPNCEGAAQANLRRVGVEVFLPMIHENKVGGGYGSRHAAPLFPGYLFARFDITSHYRTVAYARGVRRVVGFGAGPSIVDDSIIQAIQERLLDSAQEALQGTFVQGQVVRIHDRRLLGLEAVFERGVNGARRAVLLLNTLSYQARVNLDSQYVVNL